MLNSNNNDYWSSKGFIEEFKFVDSTINDRRFAFILGAGASITSGIPAANELAITWLKELYERELNQEITYVQWLKSNPLDIEDWDNENFAQNYSKIFTHRFKHDEDAGFAYLEDQMDSAKPSVGYTVLAWILANTNHRVVISTNFDNLVADSLAMQGKSSPLVIGHESLAGFAKPLMRRPLIAKIHRDLFTAPINNTQVDTLASEWTNSLQEIFKFYTPVFIGYGGNDGSLMDFLNALDPKLMPGRPFWCYYEPEGKPPENVQILMGKMAGVFVPMSGFDDLLIQLGKRLGFDFTKELDAISNERKQREEKLKSEWVEFSKQTQDQTTKLAMKPDNDIEKDWWSWQLLINAAENEEEIDSLYQKAIEKLPDCPELLGNYALFLSNNGKEDDKVESLYERVMEINPKDDNAIGNYALFALQKRKDIKQAGLLFKKVAECKTKNPTHLGNYALFIQKHEGNYDEAEFFYKKAIEMSPSNVIALSNYAYFLEYYRKDYSTAELFYQRSINSNSKNPITFGNLASMKLKNGDLVEGEKSLNKAFILSQGNEEYNELTLELWFYRLAHFPKKFTEAKDKIEELLNKGVRCNDWDFSGNIERAHKDNHPNIQLLEDLSAKINEKLEVSKLGQPLI